MSIKGCILPWIHVHGSITGQYKVCCFSEGSISPDQYNLGDHKKPITEIWNSEEYKTLRKDFLNGRIPVQCQEPCYDREEQGGYSHRQEMNFYWDKYAKLQKEEFTDKEGFLKSPPIYLDIRFGNICNFRCRMCGSFASSQWREEDVLLKRTVNPISDVWTNSETLWKELEKLLPYIEELYFAGGEPLIQEGHYKLLHFLLKNNKTDITINYNTNLSILNYKLENIYELWDKFKKINLWVSQDGYKNVGEYIRKGLEWNLFDENFKKVLPYINSISCTFQVYNVYDYTNLYLYSKKYYKYTYPSLLTRPQHLSAQILPKKEKDKIMSHYKHFLNKHRNMFKSWEIEKFMQLLQWLKHEPKNREKLEKRFKIYTETLDKSRNENFTTVVPQLAEWYENIKV